MADASGRRRWRRRLTVAVACVAALIIVAGVADIVIPRTSSVWSGLPASCHSIFGNVGQDTPPTFAGPVAATPPMGFSSYAHFGTEVDQQQILSIANAMATDGLAKANYRYVLIDDGWQGPREHGKLTVNASRFPCGIKLVADYVHAKGLKLGIYTTPATVSCGGYPGSAGHVTADVDTFASWGVDAIKLDWCSASYSQAKAITSQWHRAIQQSHRAMLLDIGAGGNPVTGSWAKYLANTWRTSDDICPSWFNKTRPHNPAATACYGTKYQSGIFDYLTSSKTWLNAPNVGPGHWADPDALEVGNEGLSFFEAQTQFSVWCMWAAPLIIGGDPRQLSASERMMLTNRLALSIDQDALGVMARLRASSGLEQIWVKPLVGSRAAVAVVNLGPVTHRFRVNLASLGLARGKTTSVWRSSYVQVKWPNAYVTVPSHGTAMLVDS